MQRLIESEILDAGAYPLQDYLSDLERGVFGELASGGTIDTYRRNLQRAYIERLEFLMTEESPEPPAFFATRRTPSCARTSKIWQRGRRRFWRAVERMP